MKCVVGLVIISFVHILFVHNGHTFKGVKMCQRDCELTKGCTRIYYDPVHLECRLLFDFKKSDDATTSAVTRGNVKTSLTKDALKTCSSRDRVVVTRIGKHVCLHTEADTAKQEYSHLLIAGWKWYQLELKTRVVQGLYTPWKGCLCVAYLKIANRFVVGHFDRLFTTPATNMKEIGLRRHIRVHEIAADEVENVLILQLFTQWTTPGFNICKVNLKGAYLRCFAGDRNLFAVDRNHKLVYVYSRKGFLASYTYNGTMTGEWGKISCSIVMVYDPVKDVLYCNTGSLLKMITKTGKQTAVAVLKKAFRNVNDMKIQSSYLYILNAIDKQGIVFVVDIKSQFQVETIKLPEDKLGRRFCLF